KLPPTLADLFKPRPPLKYAKPLDYDPSLRRTHHILGVSQFLDILNKPDPDYRPTETWLEQKAREKRVKQEVHEAALKEATEQWNPANDPQVRGDPYKTLFISRLSYEVNEQDLEKEFVRFGPIERVRVVRDNETGKSSGYAFIVFERERDLKAAYKETNGLIIKGRKVLVDVERGRTVKDWKPRKLGGGLGGRHYTK
ncbi:RNA-binding domain-containing protein, partial [Nadsonia fulvescens var. elongata DSM 6958]